MAKYLFAHDINHTGKSGIINTETKEILCWCNEKNSIILLAGLNKKSKKDKKVVQPPSLDEVKKYFKENGYSEEAAIRAFNHYDTGKDPETGQWRDSQGTPVVIWKQKVRTNWFNDRNKIGAFTKGVVSPSQPGNVYAGSFFDKDKKISSPQIKLDADGFGKAE